MSQSLLSVGVRICVQICAILRPIVCVAWPIVAKLRLSTRYYQLTDTENHHHPHLYLPFRNQIWY